MSLFAKRKGRRISSFEDDDEPTSPGGSAPTGDEGTPEPAVKPIRFGKRPLKQSALRRSININDPDSLGTDPSGIRTEATDDGPRPEAKSGDGKGNENANENSNENEKGRPAVVRPSMLGRSSSRRRKNRLSTASITSRLEQDDDDDDNDYTPAVVTPKREKASGGASLTQRVLETNALRKSLSSRLPTRQRLGSESDEDDAGSNKQKQKQKQKSDYGHAGGDDDDEDDDGRPRYSQAYLDELQNSTPNTPVNLAAMQRQEQEQEQEQLQTQGGRRRGIADDADLMDLDPAELDGAMLVDSSELVSVRDQDRDRTTGVGFVLPPPPAATVLTETEIQERKDRRARRALETGSAARGASNSNGNDNDDDDDDDDDASGYISLLTDEQKRKRKEKESTRLVRDDEDFGEGFDEFVEDKHAPRALGKKAERDARRRRKQEMADLISAAGVLSNGGNGGGLGNGDDDSDDSEAERRAAYDAAQTRAGMDGLQRVVGLDGDGDGDDADGVVHGGVQIPKMASALPDLADCLQQMQSALQGLEASVAQHRHRLAEVEREKAEIAGREAEVQSIMDAAAAKYQAVLGGQGAKAKPDGEASGTEAQGQPPAHPLAPGASPLRAARPPGLAGAVMPIERGLVSLGTTPTRRPQADDYF